MSNFTELESSVIEHILSVDTEDNKILRNQFSRCQVDTREMTGVGFYTMFQLPDDVVPIEGKRSLKLGDIHVEIPSLQYGAGFLLFIKDGFLEMLEGYTFDEPWPESIEEFKIVSKRDRWGQTRMALS